MNEWAIYNQKKIELTKKRIRRCIEKGEDFKIFLFDIDDTVNRSTKATEEQIEKINFKASKKYKRIYDDAHPFFGDELENEDFNKIYRDLRNQILEDYGPYLGAIDYDLIHRKENLYEHSMEFINHLINNHDENVFVLYLSHYNPEREAVLKIQRYYEYSLDSKGESNLDGIIVLPVFEERYEPNGKKRMINSKAISLISQLGLSLRYLSKCFLIDDSGSVRRDFKERGGIVIPAYLEKGYLSEFEDDKDDRQRVIINWDPYHFQTILSKIDYERRSGIEETKNYKIKRR